MALSAAEKADADATFNGLISHAEPLQGTSPYKKATLIQCLKMISLRSDAHKWFGLFQISFEALNEEQHTYRIHRHGVIPSRVFNLPMMRTLLLSTNHTIDPPSAKLLALHRAIAVILELSAAGEYINHIIRHMEEIWVRNDGSVELGRIVALKLDGWLDGVAA
ncbi:hypothetical protein FQN55_000759 [Onygenales sp. PD_40]|nr:hypothetical protein FQN55_000759 [Onygenales sp. PD_40]